MPGPAGKTREPRATARARRNADADVNGDLVGAGEVIGFNNEGQLTLVLATDPGLQNVSGELSVLVQGVLDIDASGVFVNIGDGLENNSGALRVALATDPGLEFSTGDLRVQLDGTSLSRGASGMSVTAPEGRFTVTAVQTGTYNAAVGELVLCDPSGAGFTVNLPAASGNSGRHVWVKNTTSSTNTITIDGSGAETIDGATTTTITTGFGAVRLVCDGSGWHVL